MAIHSSILAWKIPWTEEPGRLKSMGLQKVRHHSAHTHTHTHTRTHTQLPKLGFLGGSVVKNLSANAGEVGSILGLGRSPGEGNDNLLQYSCLENPMDGGGWWASVHGVAKTPT